MALSPLFARVRFFVRSQISLPSAGVSAFGVSPATISAIEALDRLEQESPESAQVARLRFLSGFSIEQTAILLDIAPRTVSKRWNYARAWLRRAIAEAA